MRKEQIFSEDSIISFVHGLRETGLSHWRLYDDGESFAAFNKYIFELTVEKEAETGNYSSIPYTYVGTILLENYLEDFKPDTRDQFYVFLRESGVHLGNYWKEVYRAENNEHKTWLINKKYGKLTQKRVDSLAMSMGRETLIALSDKVKNFITYIRRPSSDWGKGLNQEKYSETDRSTYGRCCGLWLHNGGEVIAPLFKFLADVNPIRQG